MSVGLASGAVHQIPNSTLVAKLRRAATSLSWPLTIFALALVVRSIWVAYAPSDPSLAFALNDPHFYYHNASSLAAGNGYTMPWVGGNTAYWPPGYPLVLASLFRLFAPHVSIAWGMNIVLGALTCVLLYYVGRSALNERVGIVAGLLLALFPGHVFFASLVLSEVAFTFLLTLAMLLILVVARTNDKTRWPCIVFLGLVAGFAALMRGQGLFVIPVALVFWFYRTGDWTRALPWATAAFLTAAVIILPWTVRNYVQMGSPVPISTNDGVNLYMGHNAIATGRMMYDPGWWATEVYSDLPPAKREVAASNLLLREGIEYMFTHPVRELHLSAVKLRALYEDDEEGLREIPIQPGRIGLAANVYYFATLALSAGGLFMWLRNPRGALGLPLLVIAVFTVGQLLFFGNPRFHYPMLPSFALLAAAALVSTAGGWRASRRAARAGQRESEQLAVPCATADR